MELFSLLIFAFSLLRVCEGFATGAPPVACVDMTPGHLYDSNASTPISPQEGESLFSVSLDKDEYGKGGQLKVTVTGTASFIGFLLQARPAGEDEPVGTFSVIGEKMQTIAGCSSTYPEGALTHADQYPETTPWDEGFTVTWTAPDKDVGDVTFYATVAQNHDIFWVQLPSETIAYSSFSILQSTTFMFLLPIIVVVSKLM